MLLCLGRTLGEDFFWRPREFGFKTGLPDADVIPDGDVLCPLRDFGFGDFPLDAAVDLCGDVPFRPGSFSFGGLPLDAAVGLDGDAPFRPGGLGFGDLPLDAAVDLCGDGARPLADFASRTESSRRRAFGSSLAATFCVSRERRPELGFGIVSDCVGVYVNPDVTRWCMRA